MCTNPNILYGSDELNFAPKAFVFKETFRWLLYGTDHQTFSLVPSCILQALICGKLNFIPRTTLIYTIPRSAGCIFAELANAGRPLFPGSDVDDQIKRVGLFSSHCRILMVCFIRFSSSWAHQQRTRGKGWLVFLIINPSPSISHRFPWDR